MPIFGPSGGGYPPIYHVFHFYQGDPFALTTTHYNDLVYIHGGVHNVNSGSGNDVIYSNGDCEIYAGSGNDIVYSLDNDLTVNGGSGNDTLNGSAKSDNLHGGADDDVINAGAGGDFIAGGTGDDTLSGGTGADWFDFDIGDGHDVITDYQAGIDDIAIHASVAGGRPEVSWDKVGDVWIITYGPNDDTITLESQFFNPDDLLIS